MHNTEELMGVTLNDRYNILEKIGTGGMALVYKAHDNVLDRNVAIKMLRDNYDSESSIVTNFIKEARSSASLVHPNVVSVYDVSEHEGYNYMVMELVSTKMYINYSMIIMDIQTSLLLIFLILYTELTLENLTNGLKRTN